MAHIRNIDHGIHAQIMTGMTSTPDLNEGEKGLEERSNIDEQNV